MPIRIRRGLDLPLAGAPDQEIDRGADVTHVALIGSDYIGMKPTMLVEVGEDVHLGQAVFEDKKNPGVQFTAPGSGKVVEINRGDKRRFQSLVIELAGDDQIGFQSFENRDLTSLSRDDVVDQLVQSGLWTAIRRRPYSKTPGINENPFAIFVQAIDTRPLAPFPGLVIDEQPAMFRYGLQVLSRLTEGTVYVCSRPGFAVPGTDPNDVPVEGVQGVEFDGPHPAGLPGTHIHKVAAASENRPAWHLDYQDTIAIGSLFVTGKLTVERVISLAGPQVERPRLLRTRWGASIEQLTANELSPGDNRVISGSVLNGQIAAGPYSYLGRYDLQVSVLKEGRDREFLGWQKPGFDKFSATNTFASAPTDGKPFCDDNESKREQPGNHSDRSLRESDAAGY